MEIEFLAIADGLRFMPNVCEHSSSMQCKISINKRKEKKNAQKIEIGHLKAIHRRGQTKNTEEATDDQIQRSLCICVDTKIQRAVLSYQPTLFLHLTG